MAKRRSISCAQGHQAEAMLWYWSAPRARSGETTPSIRSGSPRLIATGSAATRNASARSVTQAACSGSTSNQSSRKEESRG
ncbi:MAG TPA: hypothetical protein VM534_06895 [Thermoanaerobaculia bacterium]|nr:hypothetical protein [Thermoanaerobaculia bacterium]